MLTAKHTHKPHVGRSDDDLGGQWVGTHFYCPESPRYALLRDMVTRNRQLEAASHGILYRNRRHYGEEKEAQEAQREEGLPCSEKTLAKYAVIGDGPIYSKFGR